MFFNKKKSLNYERKYLKYKSKYYNLKKKQIGGATPEKRFSIYTTGIGYWNTIDPDNNLMMNWINGFFDNILRQIPNEYTHIYINHYDLFLYNQQHGDNPFNQEILMKYKEFINRLTISDQGKERVVSSEFKIEPFNDELLTMHGVNFSTDCLIIDFAHLYHHHETELGTVISSFIYPNQDYWSTNFKKLPVLRFGFANDPIPKIVGEQCKLFIINPDGMVLTYVDILRLMGIKVISSEPFDTISNVFLEGGNNINKIVEKIVKKISGKKYSEASDIYTKIEQSKVNICIVFDMLFKKIPMNNIFLKVTEEQLKNTFKIYESILPSGTTLEDVRSNIYNVFIENDINLN